MSQSWLPSWHYLYTDTMLWPLLARVSAEDSGLPLPGLPDMGAFSLLSHKSVPDSSLLGGSTSMQIRALPENNRANLNVGSGVGACHLKYSLFVLSVALLKLFWNYFGVCLKWTLHPLSILSSTLSPFSFLSISSHSPTEVGACRGGGRMAVMPSEPLTGSFPPSSHVLSSSSLWSSGKRCLKPPSTLEAPCLCVAPLSVWCRIGGP